MSVDIPEAFHSQLTEFDSFDEISAVGKDSVLVDYETAKQSLGPAGPKTMPSNFPAQLTPEEVNECWKKAKKELIAQGVSNKHAIQRRAIELIQQYSFVKASQIELEQRKSGVTMTDKPKKKRRIRVKQETKLSTSKLSARSSNNLSTKRAKTKAVASSRMLRPAEAETPKKKKKVVAEPYEISLTFDNVTVTTRAIRVIDDPDNVVLMLSQRRKKQLLHIPKARDTEIGELMISYGSRTNFRNVLIRPFRFLDNNTVYILFVVIPDGV